MVVSRFPEAGQRELSATVAVLGAGTHLYGASAEPAAKAAWLADSRIAPAHICAIRARHTSAMSRFLSTGKERKPARPNCGWSRPVDRARPRSKRGIDGKRGV